MGIRCTQIYGLNEAAKALLSGGGSYSAHWSEEGTRRYDDGRIEPFVREGDESTVLSEDSGEFYCGMFEGEEYPLLRHTLPDGRVLREAQYASPWSSGPCVFLALVEDGKEPWRPADEEAYAENGLRPAPWARETLWRDDEIEAAI